MGLIGILDCAWAPYGCNCTLLEWDSHSHSLLPTFLNLLCRLTGFFWHCIDYRFTCPNFIPSIPYCRYAFFWASNALFQFKSRCHILQNLSSFFMSCFCINFSLAPFFFLFCAQGLNFLHPFSFSFVPKG